LLVAVSPRLETSQTAVQDAVDRVQLLRDLEVLSADDMEGRLIGSPGGERARAYVVERFRESGITPFGESFEQPFPFRAGRRGDGEERNGANVVGYVVGTDAPDRYIVITAHFDHVGVRDGVVFNGADDNASGTAALFALGEYFSGNRPAHSIVFAAVDGEEGGLRGARAFVADPPVPLSSIALNLNLDMIGRDPDDLLYAVGTFHYPFLKPYLEGVARTASIDLRFGHDDPGQEGVENWTRSSDHYAFHQEGIPFIYFGVEDFDQHHKATDDYATMAHDFYVRAVATIVDAVKVFDADLESIARARER
jgi:Zn-dependent M28 family amino/carboxypeptidase